MHDIVFTKNSKSYTIVLTETIWIISLFIFCLPSTGTTVCVFYFYPHS